MPFSPVTKSRPIAFVHDEAGGLGTVEGRDLLFSRSAANCEFDATTGRWRATSVSSPKNMHLTMGKKLRETRARGIAMRRARARPATSGSLRRSATEGSLSQRSGSRLSSGQSMRGSVHGGNHGPTLPGGTPLPGYDAEFNVMDRTVTGLSTAAHEMLEHVADFKRTTPIVPVTVSTYDCSLPVGPTYPHSKCPIPMLFPGSASNSRNGRPDGAHGVLPGREGTLPTRRTPHRRDRQNGKGAQQRLYQPQSTVQAKSHTLTPCSSSRRVTLALQVKRHARVEHRRRYNEARLEFNADKRLSDLTRDEDRRVLGRTRQQLRYMKAVLWGGTEPKLPLKAQQDD